MLAAVRSGEAAIEDEHDMFLPAHVRKPEGVAGDIGQTEIRRRLVEFDLFAHGARIPDGSTSFSLVETGG